MKIEHPALDPLAAANQHLTEIVVHAREEGVRLQNVYSAAASEEFRPPADIGPAEFATLQQRHGERATVARNELRNYSPERRVEFLASNDARSKPLLFDAIAHLRQRHQSPSTPTAPVVLRKKGIVARIEAALGDPVVDAAPVFPAARPLPVGGLFGQPEKIDVMSELARVEKAVASFPLDMSYRDVLSRLNAISAAMRQQEPPRSEPVRMDRPFIIAQR